MVRLMESYKHTPLASRYKAYSQYKQILYRFL